MNTIKVWGIIISLYAILIAFCMGIGYVIGGNSGAFMGLAFVGVCILYGIISTYSESSSANGNTIHINNVVMDSPEAQGIFDYFKTVVNSRLFLDDILKDVNLRREYNKNLKLKNALSKNDDFTYIDALNNSLEYKPTSIIIQDIILNPQEKIVFQSINCVALTLQRISSNISYGGFRYNNGIYRFGNVTYYKKDFEDLKTFGKGHLTLTNQKLIFKGNNNRIKTISIGDIISIDNYEDTGVTIFMKNREKPIVFNFYLSNVFIKDKYGKCFFREVDTFYKAINDVFYKRNVPKDVQELRKETDEVNSKLAHMKMVSEGLEEEFK